ncbi:MAG: AraC family transcriptional regulator [Mucilaginibacter sp.]
MKPQRLTITSGYAHSFSARCDLQPDINNSWHYHDELELIYFKNGGGTQFIGDSISNFGNGDVVLVGSNLPHFWQYDAAYFTDRFTHPVEVYVVHFSKDFWGEAFLSLPENREIARLIERSKRGISLKGDTRNMVAGLLKKITEAEGTRRLLHLLEALQETANCKEADYLASFGFKTDFAEHERDRIHFIYNYTITNYKKKIGLREIAEVAKISPNSFCKFFKSRTGKTYSFFTNEIRVGHACRLLIENKLNIKEICYECGFNNFVSFHKTFKDITGMTPLKYQKIHF